MKRQALQLWYVLHNNHVHVADDTRAEVESGGKWRFIVSEQAVSVLVVLGRELDKDNHVRNPIGHLCEVQSMTLIVFVDNSEFCSVGMIHFRIELEFWELCDRMRWVGCRVWPQSFGRWHGS